MARGRRLSGWLLPLAFLAALLASCGGGGSGGGGGGTPITGNFFPLDSDGRWFYAATGGGTSAIRVVGPGMAAGVSGTLVETVDEADGSVVDQMVYAVAADGVRQYPLAAADPITAALSGVQLLRYPLQTGDSYVTLDTTIDLGDLDDDGRSDRVALRVTNTIVGLETVTTPAGTFTGALRQRQVIRVSVDPTGGGGTITVTTTVDTWYGRDVGPLQSTGRIVGPGVDETFTDALTAYGVGGRRSETVAPTVLATTPTMPVRSFAATVTATFSEPMDVRSVSATTFTLRDPTGASVPGTVTMLGNVATFRPTTFIQASGTYTATISGALDRVGNPLAAPHVWTFVVDDTAPGVVGTVPTMGAVDVALGSSIVVDFSEAIASAPANALNIELVDDLGASRPIALTVVGSRLTVTPTSPLALGRTYQLRLAAQTDLLGNRMANYALDFRTVAGRFAYPAALIPGVLAYLVGIGDVTGDGIADVLFTTLGDAPAPYTNGLFLLAGRADGSRAAPVRIDVGPLAACPAPTSFVIGDVDGDGRSDVVIGTFNCGLHVLRQSASGTLLPSQHFDTPLASAVRMADLDGDGKLEVIGSGGSSLGVWSRNAGGMLVQTAVIPADSNSSLTFEIVDINGDGRPDFVRTLLSGPGHIGISLQQPDGSFGARVDLSTPSAYGVGWIAVGDVNGDGRKDIVATGAGGVWVFQQAANGSFTRTDLSSAVAPYAVVLADMNHDGRPDVVVSHGFTGRVGVYYQQIAGSLSVEDLYAAPEYGSLQPMAIADIDADGRRDILINGQWLRQFPDGGMAALRAERSLPAAVRTLAAKLAGRSVPTR